MHIRFWSFPLLLTAGCISMGVHGSELIRHNFDAIQLAWTKVPGSSTSDESVITPKPRVLQPTPIKPIQPATVVPAQPLVTKPVQSPVAKPIPQPVIQPANTAPLASNRPPVTRGSQSFKWLIGLGAEIGGDELGTVTYSDGSTASVKANTGVVLNFGAVMPNGNSSAFATQLTVGYKSGGPRLRSNDVNWSAIPIELIEQYRTSNLRMGLGISYQLNPQLKVNLPTSSSVSKYKNAIGLIAQIGWAPIRSNYSIDLRYTSIKFQSSDVPDSPLVNGNVGGLYMNYFF